MVIRKLIATFITVTLSSFVLASFFLFESTSKYNLGNHLVQGALFYGVYIGAIVLVYGNAVSMVLEYFRRKWFKNHNWVYILFHGLFGLANGLLFQSVEFALAGMVVALFYAIIDRWLFATISNNKKWITFLIAPILLYGLSWGVLQITSPPMPHFTKEEAVEFATSGIGTVTDLFPKQIGEKAESILGYNVIRETKVEELEQEVYIVTFIEKWLSDEGSGNWYISYKVERGQSVLYEEGGTNPPYR
jgi:hypothetical protein